MKPTHPILGALVIVAILLLSWRAAADELPMSPEAHGHLQRGLDAYKAKDYPTAIAEFSAGYALDPRKEFLFAWAQSERLNGNCAAAVDLYEKFIAAGPSQAQQSAAQQNIDRCRESLKVQPAPAPEPAAIPDPAAAAVPDPAAAPVPDPATGRRAWWKDGWGASLVGAGVVSLGVGVGFTIAASASSGEAERAPTYDEYATRQDEAAGRRTIAAVAYGTGIGLVAAGAVRYYLVRDRRPDHERHDVAVSIDGAGGATVWMTGKF